MVWEEKRKDSFDPPTRPTGAPSTPVISMDHNQTAVRHPLNMLNYHWYKRVHIVLYLGKVGAGGISGHLFLHISLLLKYQQGNNRSSSFTKGFNSFFTHISLLKYICLSRCCDAAVLLCSFTFFFCHS